MKELVENALDAEATHVSVTVEGGGRSLIQVSDDGTGMDPEDVVRCLERHATSKIRTAQDLERVRSLGFRGEALPSIASVSRMELVSRPRSAPCGTRVVVTAGSIESVEEVGAPVGTVVRVQDLFFNVPARLKFLKKPATEVAHVVEMVTRSALARPEVLFHLCAAGRTVLDVPPAVADDPRGRIARILGRALAERLMPISPDTRPHRLGVEGWISEPGVHERTSRSLYVFLNGRFIRDRTIQHGIQEAYRTFLERGRFPAAVLYLSEDPGRFDVNVHPQKTEIRFERPQEVHRAVVGALARTLEQSLVRSTSSAEMARALVSEPAPPSVSPDPPSDGSRPLMFRPRAWSGAPSLSSDQPSLPAFEPATPKESLREANALGLLFNRYLLAQTTDALMVVDVSAVHRKIAFLNAMRSDEPDSLQSLLIPLVVELDPARAARLQGRLEHVRALGLALEPFGTHSFSVRSLPADMNPAQAGDLLRDLADDPDGQPDDTRHTRWARKVAGRSARPLPQDLAQQQELLAMISRESALSTGVDGQPCVLILGVSGLQQLFRSHG